MYSTEPTGISQEWGTASFAETADQRVDVSSMYRNPLITVFTEQEKPMLNEGASLAPCFCDKQWSDVPLGFKLSRN